jgi:hypothetical protein
MGCACGQEPEDINPLPEPSPASYWVPALIGVGVLGIFWLTRKATGRAGHKRRARRRR